MRVAMLSVALAISGCITTTSHYGRRPDFSAVELGMTRAQVIAILGKPAKVAATHGATYLQYGWDDPWDGSVGAAEDFFVRLVDGKVESFGEKGDFDSTVMPKERVQIEVIAK
jgi:hypothetical protein